MKQFLVYPAGTGQAVSYAAGFLTSMGIPIVDHPTPEATHLLLDCPCRHIPIELLERLPEDIILAGGNLDLPGAEHSRKYDFLKDETYLGKNAAITAQCALRLASEHLPVTLTDAPALVIGWGRIGKCLADLLKRLGCSVAVAARRESDLGMLEALGYAQVHTEKLYDARNFRIVFNTVPAPVSIPPQSGCLKIDLASRQGLSGDDVIWARGLPGLLAPESSGKLIAQTALRYLKEETS